MNSLENVRPTGSDGCQAKARKGVMPLSIVELRESMSDHQILVEMSNMLVYGMYPQVRQAETVEEQAEILRQLVDEHLAREQVKNPGALRELLVVLARSTGQLVSTLSLSKKVGISTRMVDKYLELLKNSGVLLNLRGFRRDLKTEIIGKSKWYFCDLGIRNMLLRDLAPPQLRSDIHVVWESFLVAERLKTLKSMRAKPATYFWQASHGQAVDLVEDHRSVLRTYHFKWMPKIKRRAPVIFLNTYPDSTFDEVTPRICLDFITSKSK